MCANENLDYKKGMANLSAMVGENRGSYIKKLNDLYDGLGDMIAEQIYGKLFNKDVLDLKTRQLINIALLLESGDKEQILFHVQCALNLGISGEQVLEMIMQSSIIIGIPKALHSMKIVKELLSNRT